MGGLFDSIGVAYGGLQAAHRGVELTSHNIANVNTEGFHRREVRQSPAGRMGPLPSGVVVEGETRIETPLLERQLSGATARHSEAETQERYLAQLEQSLATLGDSGLGGAITALFSSFSQLATRPDDLAARSNVLVAAQRVATQFNTAAERLRDTRAQIDREARAALGELNEAARTISEINAQIVQIEVTGASANDLRDRRELLLDKLASDVGASYFVNADGQATVLVGGAVLVQENTAHALELAGSEASLLRVNLRSGTGELDVTRGTGGRVGALLELRDQTLPAIDVDLDDLAFDLAQAINTVHRGGVGLDGTSGQDLFLLPATADGAAESLALNSALGAEGVAAAGDAASLPSGNENALELLALADAKLTGGGSATAVQGVANLTGTIAALTGEARTEQAVTADELMHLQLAEHSGSGVSLDEEMVHLVQYQRAYQASARVISTMDEMLGQLMEL